MVLVINIIIIIINNEFHRDASLKDNFREKCPFAV